MRAEEQAVSVKTESATGAESPQADAAESVGASAAQTPTAAPKETGPKPSPVVVGGEIISFDPRTGAERARIPTTKPEDVEAVVQRGREAQRAWLALGFRGRKKLLSEAAIWLSEHVDEVAEELAAENGKTQVEAVLMEILGAVDFLGWFAGRAQRALKDKSVTLHILPWARSYLSYSPIGVVGVICPWNYPLLTPIGDIAPALAAGNAVVFKPSEYSSGAGRLIERIFKAAGLPEGVVQAVYGAGDVGAALVESSVGHISFTGSTPTGRRVGVAAAKLLKPVTLELGGKDPALVLADADIEQSVAGILWGGFSNMGQTCASVERVYVHESIYDRFRDCLVREAKKLCFRADAHSQFGAMNNALQAEKVNAQLADALGKGATIAHQVKSPDQGFLVPPTILEGVDESMAVASEETFGPLLPLFRFSTNEEAIAAANDSPFGLTASVWTQNRSRGEEIARKLHAGVVTINDHMITPGFSEAPWGGVKESGVGRIKSEEALRGYSEVKYVYASPSFPKHKLWRYPYGPRKMVVLKDYITMNYGRSIGARIKAALTVVPAFLFGVQEDEARN